MVGKTKTAALILFQAFRRFLRDKCNYRAAALAYSTLLALVPLLTIIISIGGAGYNQDIQSFFAEALLPTSQKPIMEALLQFTQNARQMGVLGSLFFLVTILFLFNAIETNLNYIFRVSTDRQLLRRLLNYLVVVIFTAFFAGSSLSLSREVFDEILSSLNYHGLEIPIDSSSWAQLASLLFILAGQLFMLTFLPGRKIHFKSALLGAFVGTLLWELIKMGFAFWVNRSVRMSVIYGSLSLLPLTLVWLMVAWVILLFTAELCYVHQNWRYYLGERGPKPLGTTLLQSLHLYSLIVQTYQTKKAPPRLEDLAAYLNVPEKTAETLLAPFINKGLVLRVLQGKNHHAFVPACPPEKQRIREVLHPLTGTTNSFNPWDEDPLIKSLQRELEDLLDEKTLDEWMNGS